MLNNVIFLNPWSRPDHSSGGDTTFRWKVVTCPGGSTLRPLLRPAGPGPPLGWPDRSSSTGRRPAWTSPAHAAAGRARRDVPVTVNAANMTTNGSLGALLLHHHNGEGGGVGLLNTAQQEPRGDQDRDAAQPQRRADVTYTIARHQRRPNKTASRSTTSRPPAPPTSPRRRRRRLQLGLRRVDGGRARQRRQRDVERRRQRRRQRRGLQPGAHHRRHAARSQPGEQPGGDLPAGATHADLAVDVTRTSAATVNPGGTVNWTVTVTNNGDDPAYGVDTTESFSPVAVTAGSPTATEGVFSPARRAPGTSRASGRASPRR